MGRAYQHWQRPLFMHLAWFVRLRWAAGLVVLASSVVLLRWFALTRQSQWMLLIGCGILAYNLLLWLVMRRGLESLRKPESLLILAWVQILLDLACLTALTLLTGGIDSPLLGFFVFHMVFASLLLPRRMAYAGASMAMLMLAAGLWATGQWPASQHDRIEMLAWVITLLMTVWLANRITRSLRRQRHRLTRQNRRIRAMTRTLRRQQQGMIQQEKMAAAGQMAAGVAHEIANPLASMDGLLQLMERRPEKLRPDAISTLREQIQRINTIVRRMTAFAHPGDGQWQVMPLNQVVDNAMEVIRFDPRLKRVRVEKLLAANMPPVRIVVEAIQQVIINLVINALDAVEQVAEPKLTIRTLQAGHQCCVEISDNGHGIASGHRKKLFEPFFTTKPVGKGTGLGLSISYSLIRQHGGEITVESREGQGAQFTVKLPAAGQSPSQPRETAPGDIAASENEWH